MSKTSNDTFTCNFINKITEFMFTKKDKILAPTCSYEIKKDIDAIFYSVFGFKEYRTQNNENRTQTVNINSTLFDFKTIDIGIPQGSIFRPLLFIVFVHSLPDYVKCKCVMYADDTTVLVSSSDPVTLQTELNTNLDMIANWFKSNQLTLNIIKNKVNNFWNQSHIE